MIRARYEVEAFDKNGDDLRVCVHVDSVLDAELTAAAAHAGTLAGLAELGAIGVLEDGESFPSLRCPHGRDTASRRANPCPDGFAECAP